MTLSTGSAGLSDSDKNNLGQFIIQCFDALDTYGKTPDQLENLCKVSIAMLSGYPMDKIIMAFNQWVKRNSKIPTPSDIVNIIDPPPAKPCWNTVRAIENKIKENQFVMDGERKYLTYCTRHTLQEFEQNQQARESLQQHTQQNPAITNSYDSDDYDHSI